MVTTKLTHSLFAPSVSCAFSSSGKGARSRAIVGGRSTRSPQPTLVLNKLRVQASAGNQGDDREKAVTRTGPLLAAAATAMLACVPPPVLAVVAAAAEEIENVFERDFDVSFLGQSMDHKYIIELIVFGQFVGFAGATISGLEARKRKAEVEVLNKRIVEVNKELRKELREGKAGQYKRPDTLTPWKEGMTDQQIEYRERVVSLMKNGKQQLKLKNSKEATHSFEQSLVAIEQAGDALESPWKARRKCYRGLGAASQLAGNNKEALKHMQRVLALCEEHNDQACKGDTLGVIADIYTDLGEIEKAANYYDEYITALYNQEQSE
mmetsp:Transcript_38705/g.65165  ORF Transcript_38705/g.65165 Transcript_38705/m.65165 type:complete len:323 (+) Transcript_38705:69-1037(+)|eukprot:CAMPEP_0198213194 /NCGR_PEP_ID=MMETSP1445-20131203/28725_1 /TAXON_ID=36898 /ORGANISM="Pyramimonas sp., Strain CCMP2087" /LENGTH=322 /DNA_ID=CAMNT_0043887805 /DNA_START=59 /DNA_END=1027 /DNA_ORIENTATION=+